MSDGPQKTRYNTNPLEPLPEEAAEPGGPDPDAPTRPMQPEQAPAHVPRTTDPAPARPTAYQHGDGPYATRPGPPSGYMPPSGVAPPVQQYPLQGQQYPQPQYIQQGSFPLQQQPVPPTPSIVAQLGLKPNFAAMTCYMPFIGIVASIVLTVSEPPDNTFVRFHAKQSLFAHVAFWAVAVVFSIARASTPLLVSWLLLLPQLAFFFTAVAAFIYLMMKTYRWQTVKIPVIGDQVE